jgi:hypothetical protein
MRIAIGLGTGSEQTKLDVYPEDGDASFAETWSPIIIDETTKSITRVYQLAGGGK